MNGIGVFELKIDCEFLPVRLNQTCLQPAAFVPICCKESWESQPPCPALSLSHTHTHTQPTLCLYKGMGAGHPSVKEKKENKDEIQVRTHPETSRQGLACEHKPLQRWGYFWSWGFTQWIYITGIPLMSALKRFFFLLLLGGDTWSLTGELNQQSTIFGWVNRLYKHNALYFFPLMPFRIIRAWRESTIRFPQKCTRTQSEMKMWSISEPCGGKLFSTSDFKLPCGGYNTEQVRCLLRLVSWRRCASAWRWNPTQ